jgi:hypothetical protein
VRGAWGVKRRARRRAHGVRAGAGRTGRRGSPVASAEQQSVRKIHHPADRRPTRSASSSNDTSPSSLRPFTTAFRAARMRFEAGRNIGRLEIAAVMVSASIQPSVAGGMRWRQRWLPRPQDRAAAALAMLSDGRPNTRAPRDSRTRPPDRASSPTAEIHQTLRVTPAMEAGLADHV